ncbi:hypothetical protein EVAR_83211_1, partial [Eumeta japonica]
GVNEYVSECVERYVSECVNEHVRGYATSSIHFRRNMFSKGLEFTRQQGRLIMSNDLAEAPAARGACAPLGALSELTARAVADSAAPRTASLPAALLHVTVRTQGTRVSGTRAYTRTMMWAKLSFDGSNRRDSSRTDYGRFENTGYVPNYRIK